MLDMLTTRTARESTHPQYKAMLRGVFLDRQGKEQHFVYQVTEEPEVLAADVGILRPAVEVMFTARGCELLTLQLAIERQEAICLDALLGRAPDQAFGTNVVPLSTAAESDTAPRLYGSTAVGPDSSL
jgi:hypothetical protein